MDEQEMLPQSLLGCSAEEQLAFLAHSRDTDLAGLAGELLGAYEQQAKAACAEAYPEDEQQANEAYQQELAAREAAWRQQEDATAALSQEQRQTVLEEEFAALRERLSRACEPGEWLDKLLETAKQEGISPTEAYGRFCLEEQERIGAQRHKQQEAAASSAGSLAEPLPEVQPEQTAFVRSFRAAMR